MNTARRELMIGAALAALALRGVAQARPRSSGGGGLPLPATGAVWPVPDEVLLFDGSTLRPLHDRNKILVLYWWASWCPFCALQSPMGGSDENEQCNGANEHAAVIRCCQEQLSKGLNRRVCSREARKHTP